MSGHDDFALLLSAQFPNKFSSIAEGYENYNYLSPQFSQICLITVSSIIQRRDTTTKDELSLRLIVAV
jgi:hypothetical protein